MKALLLVDFEKEWINPDSEYYLGDISMLIEKTNRLIDYARSKGYKIIFTTHVEQDADDAFVAGTENVDIIDELHKHDTDSLITKHKISPFYQTHLAEELAGISDIVVGGILTNLCVRSVVQDAYDRDFNITVIDDCCIAFDEKTHDFTLKDLQATREEIMFCSVEEFIQK